MAHLLQPAQSCQPSANPLPPPLQENITAFEDCLGGCERILRTPIPLLYTR